MGVTAQDTAGALIERHWGNRNGNSTQSAQRHRGARRRTEMAETSLACAPHPTL